MSKFDALLTLLNARLTRQRAAVSATESELAAAQSAKDHEQGQLQLERKK